MGPGIPGQEGWAVPGGFPGYSPEQVESDHCVGSRNQLGGAGRANRTELGMRDLEGWVLGVTGESMCQCHGGRIRFVWDCGKHEKEPQRGGYVQ